MNHRQLMGSYFRSLPVQVIPERNFTTTSEDVIGNTVNI